jgi:hypothetical protein
LKRDGGGQFPAGASLRANAGGRRLPAGELPALAGLGALVGQLRKLRPPRLVQLLDIIGELLDGIGPRFRGVREIRDK